MRQSQRHSQVGQQTSGLSQVICPMIVCYICSLLKNYIHMSTYTFDCEQNAQDLGQSRNQRSGTLPSHQQMPNAAQQQFVANQGHPSYPQHQFQIPASNSQQFPARTGSAAGLPSGNLPTGQVLVGGAANDRTWRPTGRMRGSISPAAVGIMGQQPSPISQPRAPGGQPAVNPMPMAAPGYNTINHNVSPPLNVSQPYAGQYHRVLQGNPRAAETFYIAGNWVMASDLSTPPAPMFQGVNTSEGWMNFEMQRPGPPS